MLSPAASGVAPEAAIEIYLRELFGRLLNLPGEALGEDESFFSLGITSLLHQEALVDLSKFFDELSSTVLFEYPNLSLLSGHLAERSLRSIQGQ